MFNCPYGSCIDPGNPSDCLVNSSCLFSSQKEYDEFVNQKDLFLVTHKNQTFRFKNQNQVDFYITDNVKPGEAFSVEFNSRGV